MVEVNYGKCTTYLFLNNKLYKNFNKEFKSSKDAFAWMKRQASFWHYQLRPDETPYEDWVKEHNFKEVR